MAADATLSRTWKKRMVFIIAFFIGVGLWFFYDGLVAWPRQNQIFLAHGEFLKEHAKVDWPAFARSHGWDPLPPEKLHEPSDLSTQLMIGGVAFAGGLAAAAFLAICWNRKLRSDAETVYGDKGMPVLFSEMRSVDRRRWDSKGIAVVLYERDGRKRKLILDDYKYAGGEKILDEVEAHLAARTGH